MNNREIVLLSTGKSLYQDVEDLSVFYNSRFELPIFEELPRDQFSLVASISGTPSIFQGLKMY